MCADAATTKESERYVAMKIVKSHRDFTEAAVDEIKMLKAVRESDTQDEGRQRVIQLLDTFKIIGVNGTHICMIFEVDFTGHKHITHNAIISYTFCGTCIK